MLILEEQKDEIFDSLNYLNMEELEEFCKKHAIPMQGRKRRIISRIKHFLTTGEVLKTIPLPISSKAKKNAPRVLKKDALILNGLYKNDDDTRQFLKQLIGEHFHFTAFGQEWIMSRWEEGKPPTYEEYAKIWQEEESRKKMPLYKATPSAEYAYLNFMQKYLSQHPNANKKSMLAAWKEERAERARDTMAILMAIPTQA